MSDMNDFNRGVIEEFRANHGKVGGGFAGAPVVLLTTTGAKSGKKRLNPLVALVEGDTLYVFASKAGALAGNHFATLVAGLAQLAELGRLTLWEGAQAISFREA